MDVEHVVSEVDIANDDRSTFMRYRDINGVTQVTYANLGLERIILIFTQADCSENVVLLTEGTGRRLVKLNVTLDQFLKDRFGFNERDRRLRA